MDLDTPHECDAAPGSSAVEEPANSNTLGPLGTGVQQDRGVTDEFPGSGGDDVHSHDRNASSKLRRSVVEACVKIHQHMMNVIAQVRTQDHRFFYITPTSYLEFIKLVESMYREKRTQNVSQIERYENGVRKLLSTEETVAEMQTQLTALQPTLQQATKDAELLLADITKQKAEADVEKSIVAEEEVLCNLQTEKSVAMKAECEAELNQALPILDAAIKALGMLSKSDIVEVKSMKKPPPGVKFTMAAVCIMMGLHPSKSAPTSSSNGKANGAAIANRGGAARKGKRSKTGAKKATEGSARVRDPQVQYKYNMALAEDYWPVALKLLGDTRFLQKLMKYDKSNLAQDRLEKVMTFLDDASFSPEVIKKASKAAAGLCRWVHAMVEYDRVVKIVAPKEVALKTASEELDVAKAKLLEKKKSLTVLQQLVQSLVDRYEAAQQHKRDLARQVKDCVERLERARKLLSGLSEEKKRWTKIPGELKQASCQILGSTVVCSAAVAYLGPLPLARRQACMEAWGTFLKQGETMVPCEEGVNVVKLLGDSVKLQDWESKGLPTDQFSHENATMLHASNRWPLIIDPELQATPWIRAMEQSNGLVVLTEEQDDFDKMMGNAIKFGLPVLVENVGNTLNPLLNPLLQKNMFDLHGRTCINFNDELLDYNNDFRLYMMTTVANPRFIPETCISVNILNFAATQDGLEDQMLGIVMAKEEPQLDESRKKLTAEKAANKQHLRDLEDKMLSLLSESTGNILDDEVLIHTLSETKTTSKVLEQRLLQSKRTENKILFSMAGYRPVAVHASQVYFCVAELARWNPMYHFSLEWFKGIFLSSLEQAPRTRLLGDRLSNLTSAFTRMLFDRVCQSLFDEHRVAFAFVLAMKKKQIEGEIQDGDVEVLLRGEDGLRAEIQRRLAMKQGDALAEAVEAIPRRQATLPHRVARAGFTQAQWASIVLLDTYFGLGSSVPGFVPSSYDSFGEFFALNCERFHDGLFGEEVNLSGVVGGVQDGGSSGETDDVTFGQFHQLMLLRVLRYDKFMHQVPRFVTESIGEHFAEPQILKIEDCFDYSSCTVPIVFIQSQGVDPMGNFLNFARRKGMHRQYRAISMGQGQGPIAENAIAEAVDKGLWVILQNCHLAPSWMGTLEKVVNSVTVERTNPDFRLWLTTKPCSYFPVSVLQLTVKLTFEPPQGVKANLMRVFDQLVEDGVVVGATSPRAKRGLGSSVATARRGKQGGGEGSGQTSGGGMPTSVQHQNELFHHLVLRLCLFHALVQGRKRYGSNGWNNSYDFHTSDLEISISQLSVFHDKLASRPKRSEHSTGAFTLEDVPFEMLAYLVGSCNYGGRITDKWDARCLQATFDGLFEHESFQWLTTSKPTEGVDTLYYLTPGQRVHGVDGIREHLKGLPAEDSVEWFGLHENAKIITSMEKSSGLLQFVRQVAVSKSPSSSSSSGDVRRDDGKATRESDLTTEDATGAWDPVAAEDAAGTRALQGKVTNMLSGLPDTFDMHSVIDNFPVRYGASMNSVLQQEIQQLNRLVVVMKESLFVMRQALVGLEPMDASLERMVKCVNDDQVPEAWLAVSYPTRKGLGSWLVDLTKRMEFFAGWIEAAATPKSVWISGLNFPHSFLTATLQQHTRSRGIPFDQCVNTFEIATRTGSSEETGQCIHGMYLLSGHWDVEHEQLTDNRPLELHSAMPSVWVRPELEDVARAEHRGGMYACPVYRTADRKGRVLTTGRSTNFIFAIDIPLRVGDVPRRWVQRGVAAVTQLDE